MTSALVLGRSLPAFLHAHRLPAAFYRRDCAAVARDLLGAILVRREGDRIIAGTIVENEAYYGGDDPASHAYRGRTPRNAPMFGPAGHAYVYFVYGNHHMLNAVCGEKGEAAAVLIRALAPLAGFERMRRRRGVARDRDLANGPGRLTHALGIGAAQNGVSLAGRELFVCAPWARRGVVARTKRVGIAGKSKARLRFYLKQSAFVSRA
ncbi:MAG: DNA-3-methyladenine glycosylase [Myxococcota bacterium]